MNILLVLFWILLVVSVIFFENKNPGEAVFWVVMIVCIPYVGVVLYILFGSTVSIKLTRFVRKRRFTAEWRKHAYDSVQFTQNDDAQSFSRVNSKVIRFNRRYNHCPLTACSDYKFFLDGKSHYEQLFKDIDNATESIHILFYTIHNDSAGHALVAALTEKAKQGVKVWVMFDALANFSSPPSMYRVLKKEGAVVKRLKPFVHQFRSHRKIVIIDSKIGYIGGMNIGNKYMSMNKRKTPWRDTQIRLTGDCICELEEYFLKDWIGVLSKKQCLSMVPEFFDIAARMEKKGGIPCQFVAGGVDTDDESIKKCYLSLIGSAEKSIKIQSPYFVPDKSVLDALQIAASSGVSVEIMLPKMKSSFFLDPVSRYYSGQILKFGAKVYKYKGYIHAKTLTVDDELCCIGSVNLDIRSLCIDDEICGIFYDTALVNQHLKIFENDLINCEEYTYRQFENRSSGQKLAEHVFLLSAPLM